MLMNISCYLYCGGSYSVGTSLEIMTCSAANNSRE